MKVLGVIPSRYESSRFPGKPLIDLKGKTMIQRVYEGAQKCTSFYKVIVATDDERIANHVLGFGGNVVLTKDTHESGTDRCGEVAALHPEADIIVNIQGDEPLVEAQQLEVLIRSFDDPAVFIATLGTLNIEEKDIFNPNRIKLVVNHKSEALYFSRSPIPYNLSDDKHNGYLRHIGLYAYRKETLLDLVRLAPCDLEQTERLEQLRWMYYGYKVHVALTDVETPNIDTPEDVKAVLKLL